MKKLIILFCFCTMFYFGIPVVMAFADDYTPVNNPPVDEPGVEEQCVEDDSGNLDIPGSIGSIGGIVKIPVRVKNAPNNVSSFGFEIVYDTDMLEYESYDKGSLVENFDYFDAQLISDGLIRCGGAKNNGIKSGASGSVLFLKFKIKQAEPATKINLQELKDDFVSWNFSGGCFQSGCNGDINGDGEITPMDALNTFEKYLSICPTSSDIACEDVCGDVNNDGDTTPADTLCIFQHYLGLPNCMDSESFTPEANASAEPSSGKAPLTVLFSAEYDENLDGSRLKYEWDFDGDGQFDADGIEVSYTYIKKGTYTAILKVTDQDGLTDSDEISIEVEEGNSEEKVVTIIATPSEGQAPLLVHFFADDFLDILPVDLNTIIGDNETKHKRPGDPTQWLKPDCPFPFIEPKFDWDFDEDGKIDARGRKTSWWFKEVGEYPVKVTVTYDDGTVTTGETVIKVNEAKPDEIKIIARPNKGPAPLKVHFSLTRKQIIFLKKHQCQVQWDFESDGNIDAEGIYASNTYEVDGEHIATCQIIDQEGNIYSAETIITVGEINLDDMGDKDDWDDMGDKDDWDDMGDYYDWNDMGDKDDWNDMGDKDDWDDMGDYYDWNDMGDKDDWNDMGDKDDLDDMGDKDNMDDMGDYK